VGGSGCSSALVGAHKCVWVRVGACEYLWLIMGARGAFSWAWMHVSAF
jgi:hypothetical protein